MSVNRIKLSPEQKENVRWRFSRQALRTSSPPISWLMRDALEIPGMISLAAGFVDQESLPGEQIGAVCRSLFDDPGQARAALQYGTTFGDPELRRVILDRFRRENVIAPQAPVTCDEIMVGNGSQQLLYLLSETLLDPGDIVLVEAPTYFVFLGILQSFGARTVGVETDEHGIAPERLEEVLANLLQAGELERAKFLYVMTYFANPTGRTWSAERKEAVLSILRLYREKGAQLVLVEDGAYRSLDEEGRQIPPAKFWDDGNREILYLESFSKCLAPGLKIGCALGPKELVAKMVDLKGNHDFGTNNLSQQLLRRAIDSSWFDEHVARVRARYRRKREILTTALTQAVGDLAEWEVPNGGFYLWVRLRDGIDTGPSGTLFRRAINEKVLYVPGEYCYSPDRPESRSCSWLRLSYGMISDNEIEEGVRRIGRAIASIRAD